jgi:hypothetical protein
LELQTKWRLTGGGAVALSAGMAWYGAAFLSFREGTLFLLAYWGAFLLLLGVAFYCVLLDIRFIRMLYALERRKLFHETVGSPELRRALYAAHQRACGGAQSAPSDAQGESTDDRM